MIESEVTEKLVRRIESKKKLLKKQTDKQSARYLQEEILFLERDVLPAVEVGTQSLHYYCSKDFIKALDLAVRFDCDAFLIYVPLKPDSQFTDRPTVGIFNGKDGTENPGDIHVNIFNMDINGRAVEPINLFLNALA